MWPWRVKMATQNLLRLLLLLMLMMRIVPATVCCRFGSWGLVIKLNFCSDLEHKVWSRFWNWSSGMICMVKRFPTLEKSWLSCRHWLPLSLTDSLTHTFHGCTSSSLWALAWKDTTFERRSIRCSVMWDKCKHEPGAFGIVYHLFWICAVQRRPVSTVYTLKSRFPT